MIPDKVGQTVILNDGSDKKMVVSMCNPHGKEYLIMCSWIDNDGHKCEETFPVNGLTVVE